MLIALLAFAAVSPNPSSPYEAIKISPISLKEGLKAFDEICLANYPNEAGFQSSVQNSPLHFTRIMDSHSRTHNKWRSEFASAIYVRQDRRAPIGVLPQCNIDFQVEPIGTNDGIIQALDQTLGTRLGEVPARKLRKFGVRWKWRRNGHSFQLDLIQNDRTKSGQVTLSLQPG
jgi:hypothetical protein